MAQVKEVAVDLATVGIYPGTKTVVPQITRGQSVVSVSVRDVPLGSTPVLIFGQSADGFRNLQQYESFRVCPPETEGLFVSTLTPSAGILILAVSIADTTAEVQATGP